MSTPPVKDRWCPNLDCELTSAQQQFPDEAPLDSLIDLTEFPTIFSEFHTPCTPGCSVTACSCTAAFVYWSSTTDSGFPDFAWAVDFFDADVFDLGKDGDFPVRAVRSGL